MLLDGSAAAVLQGVSEVFIEHHGMGLHQFARPAARYQGLMKFAVITFAKFRIVAFRKNNALGSRELVMRRNHAALPFHVAGTEGLRHRVMFEQDSELGKLAKILD